MKVAIVGGGVAGIAAAYTLLQDERVSAVHLLEATGRYGGRACTDTTSIPGFAFDKGAQYIQDPTRNPLTGIAERLGFETVEEDADYRLRVETEDGWQTLPTGEPAVQEVVDGIQLSFDANSRQPNLIVAGKPRRTDDVELFGHATSPYGPFTESAETWQYIAADRAREAPGDGKPNLFVKKGIGSLVAAWGQQLRPTFGSAYSEHFGAVVSRIVHDDERVTLTYGGNSLTVDACIITVPVSVLGNDRIAFEPALPQGHRDALKVLRLGSYKKLALRLRTSPDDIVPGTNYYLAEDSPPGVWQCYRLPHADDVLVAHAAGNFAEALDQFADSRVFDMFKARVQTAFDGVFFTNGRAITNWSHDPAAGGAYSYSAFIGGGPEDPMALRARRALAAPVKRLRFAGEATDTACYGTLQAAYFSGEEAALDLLRDGGAA
ncbi:protoporphyrinogen oxidase [Bordetella ansorpii]|uniref:Tryptophan 2-monooxygenase n=1 Tax=Bordetella ansorpii TaxID=288768 RepID=A0A157SXF7_9BORD|nr:NAD(P)/FAD-dependent oxidoreductase [Bordetella ansorpii]SAI74733.1 protoporphyrinogen oxidase [Bordetella ansorpii]